MNDYMLIENEDYIINELGQLVFTSLYLLKRGFCCGNGCLNCPYEYENVEEGKRIKLLSLRNEGKE